MDSLLLTQRLMYQLLTQGGTRPCLLRICQGHEALWVCDLPRRQQDTLEAEQALQGMNVLCHLDQARRLWLLDWNEAGYRSLEKGLPSAIPPFPIAPSLHLAYALCRLLLLHPAPLTRQPMALNRRVLKLEGCSPAAWNRSLPAVHQECAALLGKGAPLPTLAGQVLANWLNVSKI